MSLFLKIEFFAFLLIAIMLYTCVHQHTAIESSEYVETPAVPTILESSALSTEDSNFDSSSAITRGVLITHCGSCHQSTLDTHKAGAIAVFDLDKNEAWHEDLNDHHLQGIARRLQSRTDLTDDQKEAIIDFVKVKEEHLNHE